jgi:hypothetical protein
MRGNANVTPGLDAFDRSATSFGEIGGVAEVFSTRRVGGY